MRVAHLRVGCLYTEAWDVASSPFSCREVERARQVYKPAGGPSSRRVSCMMDGMHPAKIRMTFEKPCRECKHPRIEVLQQMDTAASGDYWLIPIGGEAELLEALGATFLRSNQMGTWEAADRWVLLADADDY